MVTVAFCMYSRYRKDHCISSIRVLFTMLTSLSFGFHIYAVIICLRGKMTRRSAPEKKMTRSAPEKNRS